MTSIRKPLYISRLLVAPGISDGTNRGETEVAYELRGVVCSVCAMRTRSALVSVRGVDDVDIDLDRARAVVRFSSGARPDVDELRAAMHEVVVGMSLRRFVERITRQVTTLGRRAFRQTGNAS